MSHLNALSPVFILSAERSGSTLLRYILDSHEDVSSPGELSLGEICKKLLFALYRLRPDNHDKRKMMKEIKGEARRIIDKIMNAFLIRTGKRVWCEKTPYNLNYLDS